MGRYDNDRSDAGGTPTTRAVPDFLKNPLILILLSAASGGTGVTLLFGDQPSPQHSTILHQLEINENRMIALQEQFLEDCSTCTQAVELEYTVRSKLHDIERGIKDLRWEITRLSQNLEARRLKEEAMAHVGEDD